MTGRRAPGRGLRWRPLLVAALVLPLAGCSQVAALAPVGGDTVTTVRIAANDVLLDHGVRILRAPVCTTETDRYLCTGTAVEGDITVVAPKDADPLVMTVKAGPETVYDGPVQQVVESAAAVSR